MDRNNYNRYIKVSLRTLEFLNKALEEIFRKTAITEEENDRFTKELSVQLSKERRAIIRDLRKMESTYPIFSESDLTD